MRGETKQKIRVIVEKKTTKQEKKLEENQEGTKLREIRNREDANEVSMILMTVKERGRLVAGSTLNFVL